MHAGQRVWIVRRTASNAEPQSTQTRRNGPSRRLALYASWCARVAALHARFAAFFANRRHSSEQYANPATTRPAPHDRHRPYDRDCGRPPPLWGASDAWDLSPGRWLVAGLDEAGLVGEDDGLGAVVEVEFGEDACDVGFDGGVADDECACDLGV